MSSLGQLAIWAHLCWQGARCVGEQLHMQHHHSQQEHNRWRWDIASVICCCNRPSRSPRDARCPIQNGRPMHMAVLQSLNQMIKVVGMASAVPVMRFNDIDRQEDKSDCVAPRMSATMQGKIRCYWQPTQVLTMLSMHPLPPGSKLSRYLAANPRQTGANWLMAYANS